MSDAATKAYVDSMSSGIHVYSSSTSSTCTVPGVTLSTAGSLVYNQAVFMSLTPEETKELECLEQEYRGVIKIKRIQLFKSMPSNLRQQIIDHFEISKYIAKMENPPEDAEWSRLYELRRKDSRIGLSNFAYKSWIGNSSNLEIFLNYLTEEEMLNAHAEQCLEESLLGTKTN